MRTRRNAYLRELLDRGTPDAARELDALPTTGAHGAVLVERLRFGPPETWRGWRRGDGAVAVKLHAPGDTMPDHLERAARFRHPAVAALLGWGDCWTVHQWAPGPTLASLKGRGGVRPFLDAITGAVAALHAAGLFHGDLKPANIVLSSQGPILIDWGEISLGTEGWRPPHPASASERDLYALALLQRMD